MQRICISLFISILLLSCNPQENGGKAFTLQLLHASDLEGGVEALENAPNFAAIVDALEDEVENTLIISGGDNYISGPFFNAAADRSLRAVLQDVYQDLMDEDSLTNIREARGRVDVTIMNVIGFDATAVGNHEFDAGTNAFGDIIGADLRGGALSDLRWLGAQFPYLSDNLDFSGDARLSGLFTGEIKDALSFKTNLGDSLEKAKIASATIIERGGEKIGLIGATTPILESITSAGGVKVKGSETEDMQALAEILQPRIDALKAQGINKIILSTHLQQIALEKELATLVDGVDIIIAGGSDQLFAQEDDALRNQDESDQPYPIISEDKAGNPIAIVGTDGEYSYVGRLIVDFDAEGNIIPASLENQKNGAYATISEVVNRVAGDKAFVENSKGELVKRLTEAVSKIVSAQDGNIFGKTEVYLDGERSQVRTEETNLGNLTADANLEIARIQDPTVMISIKNGGGIRAEIGTVNDEGVAIPPQANPASGKKTGEVSELDIANSLRFNNGLSLVSLTAEQLVQVMEYAFSASAPGENPNSQPGRFPQVSGIRVAFDPNEAAGQRVKNLSLIAENGEVKEEILVDGALQGDGARTFRVVTLDFIAGGGDGYPFPEFENLNRVNLKEVLKEDQATFAPIGSEQDALARFMKKNFTDKAYQEKETSTAEDQRIINLSVKTN